MPAKFCNASIGGRLGPPVHLYIHAAYTCVHGSQRWHASNKLTFLLAYIKATWCAHKTRIWHTTPPQASMCLMHGDIPNPSPTPQPYPGVVYYERPVWTIYFQDKKISYNWPFWVLFHWKIQELWTKIQLYSCGQHQIMRLHCSNGSNMGSTILPGLIQTRSLWGFFLPLKPWRYIIGLGITNILFGK